MISFTGMNTDPIARLRSKAKARQRREERRGKRRMGGGKYVNRYTGTKVDK
jgi:hypothetical protein